jgi:hypothetical protein
MNRILVCTMRIRPRQMKSSPTRSDRMIHGTGAQPMVVEPVLQMTSAGMRMVTVTGSSRTARRWLKTFIWDVGCEIWDMGCGMLVRGCRLRAVVNGRRL